MPALLALALSLTSCGEEAAAAATETIVTITFDSNGGSKVEPVQLENGGSLKAAYLTGSKVPKYTGNRFDGWLDGSTLVTAKTTFTKSTTLTAQWVQQVTIKFSLDEGGVTGTVRDVIIDDGTAMGNKYPANPSRSGWEFKGWFNNGTQYTKDTKITIPENSPSTTFTLTAQWEEEIDVGVQYAQSPAIHPGNHFIETGGVDRTGKVNVAFTADGLFSNIERGAGVLSSQWYRATTATGAGEEIEYRQTAAGTGTPHELALPFTWHEAEAGEYWYWVKVTNTNVNATVQQTSSSITQNRLHMTITEE